MLRSGKPAALFSFYVERPQEPGTGVFLSLEHESDSNTISLCLKLVILIAISSNVRFYFFIIGTH